MTLVDKQSAFLRLLASLIEFSHREGYQLTGGELWRPDITARAYARQGKGIVKSLHCKRLAADLNLFKDGEWLTDPEDYKPLGEYWKSLSTPGLECCWGGDFTTRDAVHFSIEHEGIR